MPTASTINPNDTVLGLFYNMHGVLCQKIRKSDGTIVSEEINGGPNREHQPANSKNFIEDDFDERFSHTDTIPHDLKPCETSPLISKAVAKEIAKMTEKYDNNESDVIQEALVHFIDIIFAEHALLIRVIGSPESLAARTEPLNLKNSALHELIQLQIDVLKGPWLAVRDKIKSS